jgi:hypothetical protein
VIAAGGLALEQAQALLALLRARGHGAVACDSRHLPSDETTLVPRAFEFHPDTLIAIDAAQRRYALAYQDILGLVRAAELSEDHETTVTSSRKFSMRRAVLTGGVLRHTKTEKVDKRSSVDREEVCYVFRRSGPEPMLLRERSLQYDGLGEHRGPTVHASFLVLLDWLARFAPAAIRDERLLAHKRRADARAVLGSPRQSSVAWSNARANALAAHVLVHAHLQAQL